MSNQQNEEDNGASRKRPYETAIENGTVNGELGHRPAQGPRFGDGRHLMGQFIHLGSNQVQGNPLGVAPAQSQTGVPNGGSAVSTSTPSWPSMPGLVLNQLAGAPINNNLVAPSQQSQPAFVNAPVTQQADVAYLISQLAQARGTNIQVNNAQAAPQSAPTAYAYSRPAQAPVPLQAGQPATYPVNHVVYPNQNQHCAGGPVMAQQQPNQQAATQSAQPGHLRPFGMEPQELLNYAVMVNILHKSATQSNPNALSSMISSQPQVPNQSPKMQYAGAPANQSAAAGVATAPPLPPPSNQTMLPATAAAAALPPFLQAAAFTVVANKDTSPSSAYEHTVSPSIPSESNFNAGSKSSDQTFTIPSHVTEARQIDPKIRCVPLWTHQDESRLSMQQCWLRKQIETYPASERDVRRHTRGRNRVLKLGQVGIQCIHCKNLTQEGRGKGSSYFLSSTKGIYQAAQNILAYHFKEDTCPLISQKLLQEMRDAGSAGCPRHLAPKAGKSRCGGGKSFWEQSALHVTGLIDTTVGIRYSDDRQNYRPLNSVTLDLSDSVLDTAHFYPAESVLVSQEDKSKVTHYCFLMMSQFIPHAAEVRVAPEDSELEDGEDVDETNRQGIVCRFCRGISCEGKHRDGVFFSIKPSTLMRNKQLAKFHNHLVQCAYVPDELKMAIATSREMHVPQSDQLKRGWKKEFFENICLRLKSSFDASGETSGGELSSLSNYEV
jgi:hypothetical protein